MTISDRLSTLRELMKKQHIDYYFVPSADEHNNEYVPACWQRRAFITGFTGSAGDALIGLDDAYLWTDPRYFLQAEEELDPACFTLMRQQQGMAAPIHEWLASNAKGKRIGVDPKLISLAQVSHWLPALQEAGGELIPVQENLIDHIWKDRPPLSENAVIIWDEQYAGQTAAEKIQNVRQALAEKHCHAHVVTMLDAIAWLLNIRGSDIDYNPLTIAYLIIDQDQVTLYIDPKKVNSEHAYFKQYDIHLKPYTDFAHALKHIKGDTLLDPSTASWWVEHHIDAPIHYAPSPISMMKACKNATEQQDMRDAHMTDAIAMCRFLCWIDANWKGQTELSAADKLEALRFEHPDCRGLSFNTISGYGEHGAIIHYAANKETDIPLKDDSLYLLDSGAQYVQGTTDITRTLHFGEPSSEEKRHYTLVLKGHLALKNTIFPDGTTGEQLSPFAHQYLWSAGMDFGHGTGHGVGCYLCVHEGPQRLSSMVTRVPLLPGMIVSNEPGVYFNGYYGIRIENLCLVRELIAQADSATGHGPFYGFEDLTLVPYARKLIDKASLSNEEINWVNQYHNEIWVTLRGKLEGKELAWLEKATLPL